MTTVQPKSARGGPNRHTILGRLPRIYRPDGSPIRVLLVDDEPALTRLVTMALKLEGWQVDIATDGRSALDKLATSRPDVLILDIMLPDINGMRILQFVRNAPAHIPALFLTARDTVSDRVAGLTAGADDYMTKPFSLEELVARLRGLLRRAEHSDTATTEKLVVGDVELDGASRMVTRNGQSIPLTNTEFDLLSYLMRNPDRAIPRAELLNKVWKYDLDGKSSVVDLYVSYLRKKIHVGGAHLIHTVRGVGYLFQSAQSP